MYRFLFSFLILSFSYLNGLEKLPYCDSSAAFNCVRKYLPSNPIIVECGGCDGNDTVKMVSIWPQSNIYTFEAVPQLCDILKERTKEYENVFPFQIALGDFNGIANFYISTLSNGEIFYASSLLPPDKHMELCDWVKFTEVIEVDVILLDTFAKTQNLEYADFLWLDMQGYELNMLKASEIARNAKAIFLEVEFVQLYQNQYLYSDILEWMTENGFELVAIDCDPQTQRDFGNALFVKRN